MTAPSTAKKNAPAKATADNSVKSESTVSENTTPDNVVTPETTAETETPKVRVPEVLSANPILADFCKRYLDVLDEIQEYNKEVLAEKDSEWNAAKVLGKAKEFASPDDASKVKPEIKKVYDAYEKLLTEVANARKAVLDATSKELGVNLSAVADRDPATEAPLKEKRKFAVEIGSQLATIAKMTTDEAATSAVNSFLNDNPLPAVGRDQTRSFTSDGSGSTPKFRVNVTVSKDGEVILSESGFTKAALALTKPAFGYERGKSLKADDLRNAWIKAGNTAEKTVQDKVEFNDNNLHFVITKK
jgi:hypothetical protein